MHLIFSIGTMSLWLLLLSCNKEVGNECAGKQEPVIIAPESVEAGSEISLDVSTAPYARYYQWTGPNGFTSEEQSPVIKMVQSNAAGKYSVKVGFDGRCVQTASTNSITIDVPPAPCTPGQNTATLTGAGTLNFLYTTASPSGTSFILSGGGSQGDIEIEFAGTGRPVSGVYSIQPLGGNFTAGNVRVRLVAQSSNWPASSGSLYAKVINNKLTVTFCNLPVYNQTFSFPSRASGSVTEK